MSLAETTLIMFLLGTIGTLFLALLVGLAMRRYRRELMETGDAQTTLGIIGSVYLESKALILTSFSMGIPIGLMCSGGLWFLFFYLETPQNVSLASALLLGGLLVFLLLFWVFGSGKARLETRRVLRNYFSHRNEEILRLELVRLYEGDDTQKEAFDLIAERGDKASLVAREIVEKVSDT